MKRPQVSTVGGIGTGSVVYFASLFQGHTIGTIGAAVQAVPLDNAILAVAGLVVSVIMLLKNDDKDVPGEAEPSADGEKRLFFCLLPVSGNFLKKLQQIVVNPSEYAGMCLDTV